MIAVSTHRAHNVDAEYRVNQIRAYLSWCVYFDKIFYLGNHEIELSCHKTHFVPAKDYPSIRDMIRVAANLKTDYVAILNADIVLTAPFKSVAESMKRNNIKAATSKRWSLDIQGTIPKNPKIVDSGLDIFVATPFVWRHALSRIPVAFRAGHIKWDTWMIGFLNTTLRGSMADFTDLRCVFHPVHSRKPSPYTGDVDRINDAMMARAGMPGRKLK